MKEKITRKVFEALKDQIEEMGELKENTTVALRMVYDTNLKDGSVFEVDIIIRRKDEDQAIAEMEAEGE